MGYFATRLKELRDAAGLSQPELAARAEIGVSTLRQFEYGRREPTYGTLIKLAQGLGLSLSAFDPLQGESTTPEQEPSQARKPGRPRKSPPAEAPPPEPTPAPRRPGRPRKDAQAQQPKKGRGRKTS